MSDAHERIRQRAYAMWQERGEPEGAQDEIWLEAERKVLTDASEIEGNDNLTGNSSDSVRSKEVGEAAVSAVAGTDGPAEEVKNPTGKKPQPP